MEPMDILVVPACLHAASEKPQEMHRSSASLEAFELGSLCWEGNGTAQSNTVL